MLTTAQILEVCYKSGVTHVTIYAFSIENFKRSKYEVDALMEMAKIKLKQLVQHGELLDRYGARVRVLGQRDLVKPDVLEAVDRAVEMTSHNNNCVLNVCFPYTSREEITSAIRDTVEEYSRPLPPTGMGEKGRKSPFREERIANTIRSQQVSEHTGSSSPPSTTHTCLQPPGLQSPASSTTSLSSYRSDHDASSISTSTTLHLDELSSTSDNNGSPSIDKLSTPQTPPSKTQQPQQQPPQYPSPELITPATLTSHMYTSQDPPIDMLIRTSGVSRLSDFLLWQCHEDTEIVFLDVLWPEFDLWSFLPVLWEWQWRVRRGERLTGREHDTEEVAAAEGEDLVRRKSKRASSTRTAAEKNSKTIPATRKVRVA